MLQNGVCVVAESDGGGGVAGAGSPDAGADPTVLYVDSISISNAAAGPWEFSADVETMHVNYGATPVAGAEIAWLGP